jgi:hypothetical protein
VAGRGSPSQVFGHVAAGLGEAELLVEGPGAGVVGECVQTDPGQRVGVAPALGGQHDRAAVAFAASTPPRRGRTGQEILPTRTDRRISHHLPPSEVRARSTHRPDERRMW